MRKFFDSFFAGLSPFQAHIVGWVCVLLMVGMMVAVSLGFVGEFLKAKLAWNNYKDRKREVTHD